MASQTQTTVKALGLNINPNFLNLANGSLVKADDVIIRRENVIESRRGMSDWSEEIGISSSLTKQLLIYKDRILANYSNKLAFDTGDVNSSDREIFSDFSGTYTSASDYRIRFIESNKNLYFTTDNGIKKISATSSSEFTTTSGYIQDAGAVKAIDFTAELIISQGQTDGFLPVDSGVAYRHVWAYNDANKNLILGSPSTRNVVYNYITDSIVLDFNKLLTILDIIGSTSGGGLITDTNYYSTLSLSLNPVGSNLKTNVISLCTKLDNNILLGTDTTGAGPLKASTIEMNLAGVVTLTFTTGDPTNYISVGDFINIQGLTTASPDITIFNGSREVTTLTSTTLQFVYSFPTGATPYSVTATACDSGTTINSYNYSEITITGDDNFPISLNELAISNPITSGESATIQDTISRIISRLQIEKPAVISAALISSYLDPFIITQNANTKLQISIPTDSQGNQLNSSYFLQIYRSNVFNAFNQSQGDSLVLGTSVIPDDNLNLIFEYFPTATDFSNGFIVYNDSYPDELAQTNTPLYTNPSTGDGILQSNDIPPVAKDINLFKNYVFYANTRTKHLISNFQLLGVDNIASGDKITIANVNTSSTYTFIDGAQENTTFTVTAANATALKTAIQNKYFTINNADDQIQYYVWFRYDGTGVDPAVSNKTGVIVDLITGDTVALMCQRTSNTLNDLIFDFTSTFNSTSFTVENISAGITTNATIGNISGTNLSIVVNTQGNGENASTGQVLISRSLSAAQNIDLTARSLIRVINRTASSPIYAYYSSGDNTSPGQIILESKILADIPFYVIASGPQFSSGINGIGNSFSPDISPIHVTTGTIVNGPTGYITFTATGHGLQNGNQILITNTNCVAIANGVYTVYNTTTNTFDIQHSVLITPGTHFSWELTSDSIVSTNTIKPNRVYYSKFNQPDSVPILNFFDIGPEDQAILRIFPLRTSLFILKEDGLYRIAGENATSFTVQLFDGSCVLIAPDTVDVTENVIYAWTSKGISSITESGVDQISNPVDIELFKLATFPNFKTLTWGFGYNSDQSYTVFTNKLDTDEVATIGYRYSTLTKTWTNIVRSQTCGLIRQSNDLLYMGSGLTSIINQERKSYTRLDYADRDFELQIQPGTITNNGSTLQFTSVSDINLGDVLLQTQDLTIYTFNSLLQKLDSDPGLNDHNYFELLEANIGDNLRDSILALSLKLDADSGAGTTTYNEHITDKTVTIVSNSIANSTVITTSTIHKLVNGRIITITGTQTPASIPSIIDTYEISNTGTWGSSTTLTIPENVSTGGGTGLTLSTAPNSNDFADIKACYNAIITLLNNDSGLTYSNYQPITFETPFEAVVLDINRVTKKVTLNIAIQWVIGPVTVYKSIPCEVIYAPLTFGDVLKWKQIYQSTVMFSNTAFTKATVSFSSDLKPDYIPCTFSNYGNGIFGSYSNPGFGFGYFGGGGNYKPFRTLVPLQTQRCRFINLKFEHRIAREIIELYGVTLTGNIQLSERSYR